MNKDIIVTGIKPTGILHLGGYLGMLRQVIELQEEYARRSYLFIADYHAMNQEEFTDYQTYALELTTSLLALGLDPNKVTLFFQHDVPEVTELTWMFNTVTPVSLLERMTQYKDYVIRGKGVNAGLLGYPVLQAADILIYGGTHVPVGEDQVQHVELTRDIVRFWNNRFGQTFAEPKPILTKTARVMALNFPEKKMSKSIPGSTLELRAEPEEIRAIIRKAVTDTAPLPKGQMSPGVENLFSLLAEFAPVDAYKKFKSQHLDGTIKYVELKDALADHLGAYFAEFRARRQALLKKPDHVKKIFTLGGKRARKVAKETMDRVRKTIGF